MPGARSWRPGRRSGSAQTARSHTGRFLKIYLDGGSRLKSAPPAAGRVAEPAAAYSAREPARMIEIKGAREHNLQDIHLSLPHNRARGADGGFRLGQVHPGLRHPLRRRPAPLPGESRALCAPVHEDHGAAGRRSRDRAGADGGHRAAHQPRQPALHRGHPDRNLPFPAAALQQARHPALPGLRPAAHRPDPGRHRGADPRPATAAARPRCWPSRCWAARAFTKRSWSVP